MLFRVLGGIEVWTPHGARLEVGHPRQRWVLGALLLDAGRGVPADVLVDRVWGEDPPRRGRDTLYSYVSRLRSALTGTGAEVVREATGYRLAVPRLSVDVHLFRDLVRRAGASTAPEDGVGLWEEALGLWRGEAFAGADTPWFGARRAELDGERLTAQSDLTDALLELGRHGGLVTELIARAEQHPFDERITAQLMVALYRSGRASEALARYRVLSRRLARELGTDPGPELRRLQQRVLTADPVLAPGPAPGSGSRTAAGPGPAPDRAVAADPASVPPTDPAPRAAVPGPAAAPAANPVVVPVPRQLPACPRGFVGREPELRRLGRAVDPGAPRQGGTAVIASIAGTGGVGKTWLALRWAHDHLERFPDGQLYADLRGFDPSGQPVAADVVVRGFLDALGVDPSAVPAGADARSGTYRSLTAGRRLLVVLDNARDAAHVDPLLPGGDTCTVLVTSRNRLTGLVTARGAVPLALDVLPAEEARALFTERLGTARTGSDPSAVAEITGHCGRLPLALAIVAARAAAHPDFPLAGIAEELRAAHGSLDAFEGTDHAADARAVFSWSYRTLGPRAARLFRLLGLHPGDEIQVPAAASLLGAAARAARAALAELGAAHLVTERVPGRFGLHDLLRAYATELVAEEAEAEQQQALGRLLDHYAASAHAADLLLAPHRDPLTVTPPAAGVTVAHHPTHAKALDWFTAERGVLVRAVELAARRGLDAHTRELTWAMATFLSRRSLWSELAATHLLGLAAAQRSGDHRWQAHAHGELAIAEAESGRPEDARLHFAQALDMYQELDDPVGEARTRLSLSWWYDRQQDLPGSLRENERALALFRRAGHEVGEARALNAVGWDHAQLGDHEKASSCCRQALALQQKFGDVRGEANTWDSLGFAYLHLGEHARAVDCYRRALRLSRDLGHRFGEAEALSHLGDVHHATGDRAAARAAWRAAEAILTDTGHDGPLLSRIARNLGSPDPV
ncbi:BTAD domain-containing putative transcriptional regulator [Streptomyces sp. NPDC127068]|uniref:AfsR/SARP family transcriptional regulator n=1 Tax=Streptomyces sp. NPDC127068 TaxID=3347127 RepID=UPI003664F2D1